MHTPPTGADANRPIELSASVEGTSDLPIEGRIYYRIEGRDAFAYAEMRTERFELTGEIPSTAVTSGELVYYIWTELSGGAVLTLPMGAPTSGEFFRIVIRSPDKSVEGQKDSFVILHPTPGSTLTEEETVIAISILQNGTTYDVDKLKVFYDGKDFTKSAKFSEDLVVLSIPSVRSGAHTVALMLDHDGKQETLLSWSFIGPIGKSPRPEVGPVNANVTTGVAYEDFSSQKRRTAFLDARAAGNYGKLKWAGKTYITSLESKYLQPQNRFLAALEYGPLGLKVGDTQPRFSEFTLWGVRTRGVEFGYHGSVFNFDAAQGEIVRGIEGEFRTDTTYVTDDATGDTLQSQTNPSADSIIVADVTSFAGKYKRNLLAFRPGVSLTQNANLSFTLVKAKDQISTIEWGRAPKDNLVFGVDFNLNAMNRRVTFSTETALSLYNSDISGGPMDDAKDIEPYMVINQFFDPLPTDSSILEGNVAQTELAKKLLSELIKSSLAHRSTLTLNFYRNELRLGYKTIGRSFRSFGSPTVLTDVSGFSVEDRIRMMKSRLYVTLGYEAYADNVNGRSRTTTGRNIIRTGVSYYSPPNYPNVNLGFRIYNRKNDGVLTENRLPDGSTFKTDTRIDNTQNQYSVGIDESFQFMGFDNLAAVSWTSAITEDAINSALETNLSSISFNFNARRQPWEYRVSAGLSSQSALGGDYVVDYTSFNLSSRYNLIPKKVWLSAGVGGTMADGGNDQLTPPDSTSDRVRVMKVSFSRYDVTVGAEYQITLQHSLTFSGYIASHADEGYNVTWGGVKTFNKSSPNFVSQDDMSVRLTYNYKI